jgi:hypothetical protein
MTRLLPTASEAINGAFTVFLLALMIDLVFGTNFTSTKGK